MHSREESCRKGTDAVLGMYGVPRSYRMFDASRLLSMGMRREKETGKEGRAEMAPGLTCQPKELTCIHR